jgi:PAS domain S-box-containing protein
MAVLWRGVIRLQGCALFKSVPIVDLAASSLSSVALASVLDQSVDCVKLIGLDGAIRYMNPNGLCAMEVDDFCAIQGQAWADLWPDEARREILASYVAASSGEVVRFRAFCPTAKGTPRWWDVTVSAVTDDAGEHAGYLSISRDMTEHQLAREALEVAAAEMKHRLKNTYMMIASLLVGFARGNPNHEAFAGEMADRLVALSTAQALFLSNDAPREIGNLIPALLAPFSNAACPVVIEPLPAVALEQGQADAIALVVGELSVNSSKHGALAHGGGLHLRSYVEDGAVTIVWTERSNRPVAAHDRTGGQGLRLIERIVKARRGTIGIEWQDAGLAVTLSFRLA